MKRRVERLVDQVADGVLTGAAIKDCLDALEARRSQIEAELAQARPWHPSSPYTRARQSITGRS